jgi:membrane-bound metal-dependent hydrolase YbcI (DUF457 family)
MNPTSNPIYPVSSERKASLLQIIWNDGVSFLSAAVIVGFWAVFFFMPYIKKGWHSDANLAYIFAAISAAALVVIFWRVRLIKGIIENGIEAKATISSISFYKDRGRVEYIYNHEGQKYMRGNGIMKTKRTKNLRVDDTVIVMIDPGNPGKALIRDLYL